VPDHICPADELLSVLIPALIRNGDISEATILELADDMQAESERASIERADELTTMALRLRMMAIDAAGSKRSEQRAGNMRSRLRIVDDGASV